MAKRKLEDYAREIGAVKSRRPVRDNYKKHSLDSDEEDDNDDASNVLDDNEFEGEEEGVSSQDGEVRMTAFNMQEELEMGHFDKQGHFLWNNEKEVRDNWLDNIDWQTIKTNAKGLDVGVGGLADDSDSEDEFFDEIDTYKLIITYMKPRENINKALRRLGGDTDKLSSIERLRRKKAGILHTNKEVTELTELANKVLTNTGNMDIYQETYEQVSQKIENYNKKNKSKAKIVEAELDMYSDNFDDKEKERLGGGDASASTKLDVMEGEVSERKLMWEFKWDREKDQVEGPFTTRQMLKWSNEGYFKTGVWVRKCGEQSNFYTSNRIDFDLYL